MSAGGSKANRRVPRRAFESTVGILVAGRYHIERTSQVGEGGMLLTCREDIAVGAGVVVSFFLNDGMIIVRAVVRNVTAGLAGEPTQYGVEFVNLEFQHKRAIRNFVASATSEDNV